MTGNMKVYDMGSAKSICNGNDFGFISGARLVVNRERTQRGRHPYMTS